MTTPWRYHRTGAPDLDTLLAQRAALIEACREAFEESCRRSESNRKWTVRDQRVHEQLKAALALAEGPP